MQSICARNHQLSGNRLCQILRYGGRLFMMMRRYHQLFALSAVFLGVTACNRVPSDTEIRPTESRAVSPIVRGHIDQPIEGSRVTPKLVVAGWAFGSGSAVQQISVRIDGQSAAVPAYGGARPDVLKAFPAEPAAANSGWYTEVSTASLKPGTHEVSVSVQLANGSEMNIGSVKLIK
jgi:hypothetical protein